MAIELYDHQIEALGKIQTGSILYGGVGSGKSRTALAYFYIHVCGGSMCINGKGKTSYPKKRIPLYIITTARKRDSGDWENEALPFYTIEPIVDSWNNIGKYANVRDAYFIFDEQRVVGTGKWSKHFINIAKYNGWILLSATPGDVWMDYASVFIANGFYRNLTDFRQQHVVFSRFTKYPKIERYVNTRRLEYYRDKILVTMEFDRPTISHHTNIYVEYDKESYRRVDRDRWNIIEKRPIKNANELCLLLRRIVNANRKKIAALRELMNKHNRIIVFYNFDYELADLVQYATDIEMEYAQWNGHKHEPVPETDRWLYFVQYAAGAEAWNCITTNAMVFYSPNYSYKVMEQASGRIDRLNTSYVDLYYYHFMTTSSIDRSIEAALNSKRLFNEAAFSSGAYEKLCNTPSFIV